LLFNPLVDMTLSYRLKGYWHRPCVSYRAYHFITASVRRAFARSATSICLACR